MGRPSTYAPTLETIQRRYYVKLTQKRFEPTELGEIVNSLIEEFFPQIVDMHLLLKWKIAWIALKLGKKNGSKLSISFIAHLKRIDNCRRKYRKIQIKDEPAGFDCDLCGHPMVIKLGRYGKFYACSNFPDCRNTKPIVKEIGVECPVCHQGKSLNANRRKTGCFMVVPATLNVTLLLGTNQWVVIVRSVIII